MSQTSASVPAGDARPAERPAARTSLRTEDALGLTAVFVLMVAYALLFGWLSLERYWAYQMHALDMGNMSQAAWNTVHGHPFYFTNMRLAYNIEAWNTTTRLSFHVEALFPVISLVYLVYPHPESLLVLQTAAIALGALPVYLLARDTLGKVWPALAFALSYLLFPTLEAMNLYEFHPVALAAPLLLFAFLFAQRRHYPWFIVCCLLAMGTKEEIGLIVATFGIYVAIANRNWRVGLGTAAFGAAWSLFAALVIEHHFRQPGTLTYLHTRYGYLGHGLHGALHTMLHDPGAVLAVLFIWPKLGYLLRLLAPAGFVALFAPWLLLLGAPTFALNLFSEDFHMYSAVGDNSAELVSVVMITSILGARTGVREARRWLSTGAASAAVALYVAAAALLSQAVYGYTPLGPNFQVPSIGHHQHVQDRFVAMIPSGLPVSTQDQIDPHLSSRHYLYLLADTGRTPPLVPADSILLDVSAPTYPLPSYQLHDIAERAISTPGWGVAAADDGLILIRKGASRRTIPPSFYTYAQTGTATPSHPARAAVGGLLMIGYDVARVDLPNHVIPNLAYTLYFHVTGAHPSNLQPVLFETLGSTLVNCDSDPLGLAWFPTSRWRPGPHAYVARMQPLETPWKSPGTAHLLIELIPALPNDHHPTCSALWRAHSALAPVGTMQVGL